MKTNTLHISPSASSLAQDVARELLQYDFSTFPIKTHLSVEAEGQVASVRIAMDVPERTTGKPITVSMIASLSADMFYGMERAQVRARLDAFILRSLVEAVTHEVQEHLRRGGELVDDPHRNDPPRPL